MRMSHSKISFFYLSFNGDGIVVAQTSAPLRPLKDFIQ